MNPKKRKASRFLSLFLCFSMLFPVTGKLAFAAPAEDGLCEHHPEHTEACGYEAVENHFSQPSSYTGIDSSKIPETDTRYSPS